MSAEAIPPGLDELSKHLLRNANPLWIKPGNILIVSGVGEGAFGHPDLPALAGLIREGCKARKVLLFAGRVEAKAITEDTARWVLGLQPGAPWDDTWVQEAADEDDEASLEPDQLDIFAAIGAAA